MLNKWVQKWLARYGFVKIPGSSGSGGGYAGFFGWSSVGSREEQLKAYQNHVYKCVSLIYRRVMSVPWKLYAARASGDEEVTRHPLLDLMRAPNPYMSGMFLAAITQMHLDLAGVAFWLKIRNRLARPAELWPLSPALFSQFVLTENRSDLAAYEFRTEAGGLVRYLPEEIVYFHYPHPIHWLEGASPIQAMAYSYDIDLAARVYQRNFFQNSARPDIVFESDQQISPDDARRLLMTWKAEHQGVQKAWNPAILDNGLKANVLNVANKDMEFAALAGWTKEDILEAYGVPPAKLGTVVDVNRANGVAVDITFNSECIKPKLMLWDETVTRFLAADYAPGLYVEHDECVPRDEEMDRKERESNLKNKVTTINEERERIGLDAAPWGNVPWVGVNEIQWGEEERIQNTVDRRQEGEEERRQNTVDRRQEDVLFDSQSSIFNSQSSIAKSRGERVRMAFERSAAARSRAFRGWLRKFFRGLETETLRNLRANYNRVNGAVAGMSIAKTGAWLAEHKDEVDRLLFELALANRNLEQGAMPYIENSLITAAAEALARVGGEDVVFDLLNPRVVAWMGHKLRLIRDINQTTRQGLMDAIREGFEAGETVQQLADRVGTVFEFADRVRSLRIAQTETLSASNFGTLEGYEQSGVVERKEWIAGPGARETHAAAMARYSGDGAIPISENFEVGAGRGPAPGNIGLPEEDINCRCTILPVLRRR